MYYVRYNSQTVTRTDRLQTFHALREVAHEGEGVDSLSKAWDFTKAADETVLLAQVL